MAEARSEHFFEPLARFVGAAYLRYSFTRGTEQEIGVLVEALGLSGGELILDVGCGPGRHSHALARRGYRVLGVDLAQEFVALAARQARLDEPVPGSVSFARGDVRRLPIREASVDAAICLCQGGFGLLGGGEDETGALRQMAAALRPGARLALSAFSAYFVTRFLEAADSFEADSGVNREVSTVRDLAGRQRSFELSSTCFTPRELRLLCAAVGLEVVELWSVGPGSYERRPPDLDHPEWLLVAERP